MLRNQLMIIEFQADMRVSDLFLLIVFGMTPAGFKYTTPGVTEPIRTLNRRVLITCGCELQWRTTTYAYTEAGNSLLLISKEWGRFSL